MQTAKQILLDIAEHLPEQATFDDAMYALYVRQKREKGLRDLNEGRTYSQEEVEQLEGMIIKHQTKQLVGGLSS